MLMESPFLLEGVERWMADPQAEGEEDLLTRFRSLRDHLHYCDVLLTDASGQVRLSLAGHHPGTLHVDTAQALATALRERKPVLSDLHAGGTNQIPHLDFVVPLLAKNGETPKPVGTIILQVEAQQFLYPLIQSWPIFSRSAETLLVRREGDAVLFLSDLRHQPDTALKLRIPLSRTDVPAVMAVLGKEGIVPGKDYRGVKVLSVLKAIPDSPWFMVAKMDVAEALSVERFAAVLILVLILAMVAVAAVGMSMIWQRNQKRHYRSLLQAEEAFRVLFEVSSDAIMTLELPTWKFTSGNPATVKMFQARDEAQFVSKGPWEVSPEFQPDGARSDDKAKAIIGKAMQEGSHFFEWDHMRLDGEVFPATVLLTRVTLGEKVFLQATVRDITEAKKAEKMLRKSNELLSRDCSSVTGSFLTFGAVVGRYLREKGLLEIWSWMAPEAMWLIPPKASGVSRIFPRHRLSNDPATIDDAPVPGADTERIGCGRPSGHCTIWATRCPAGRGNWRSRTRSITVRPVDTILTPICWIWPCPTPITPIG
jgi:PAS domain S-box-containing protein